MTRQSNRRMRYFVRFLWIVLFFLASVSSIGWSKGSRVVDAGTLTKIGRKYGDLSKRRVESWLELIRLNKKLSEREKLEVVNRFFNQFEFVDDLQHWGKEDYWASPIEMLSTRGGDCEDFAIAKYFTLKELGVDERRMHLTYVKSIPLNQAHMVLTYHAKPGAIPLVLDNLDGEIKPADLRKDLLPVYSFNGDGLWLAGKRGEGKRVGRSNRIRLWRDLLRRMTKPLVK